MGGRGAASVAWGEAVPAMPVVAREEVAGEGASAGGAVAWLAGGMPPAVPGRPAPVAPPAPGAGACSAGALGGGGPAGLGDGGPAGLGDGGPAGLGDGSPAGLGDGGPAGLGDGGPAGAGAPGTRRSPAVNWATSPITTTAGFVTPASLTASASSASGAVTTRCCLVQPSDTTAPGVAAASPAEISVSAIAARWSTAISSTRVIPLRASAAQSTELRESPGRTCPASTQKPWLIPRWVTGMPAAAGTEVALVIPGTTSTGTPAARHASTSSRPRPNTNGSPPLSRTTARPARACSTSARLMWSWRMAG